MSNFSQPQPLPRDVMNGIHADMNARATHEHLERLLEQARSNSEEQRKAVEHSHRQARHAIAAAWVGVGVAIVVGVATILFTVTS